MFRERLVLGLLFVIFATPIPIVSQTNQTGQTPSEQPRKIKKEAKDAYARWIKDDVSIIISDDEKAAFEKLKTDEEREQFIKIFWNVRDPDPDTEENEFREQHYERIAYANEHFSSGKPGWMTDRGRIYIKFGKPDEIESHPAGGQYTRPSYEGHGSITYPFEKWFYRYIPGVGTGVEIEFVDPTGSGEYRTARNMGEKNALAHVSGLGSPIGSETSYRRQQDSPFEIARLLYDLEKAPEFPRNYMASTTGSPVVDDNPLNFDISPAFFKHSDNRVVTAFTVQIDNKELSFADSGALQVARANIFTRIVTVTDRRVGAFEDSVSTTATVSELKGLDKRKVAYSKAVVLTPGRYRVDVIVRDVLSGATGVQRLGFEVPKYENDKLATSSIVLAARLESMEGKIAAGPFMIGQTKVIPNMAGVFPRGQPVGVYMQLYNAGIDQTTLRPSVDVEYVLQRDAKVVRRETEDWRGVGDSGQRLTLTRLYETRELDPGEYQLIINIRDRVTGQMLTPIAKFTVQ